MHSTWFPPLVLGCQQAEPIPACSGVPEIFLREWYHDYTAETYIILSGGGVLTTGGTILNKKPSAAVNVMNGPGGKGTAGPGAYSRKVGPGDIIIIPAGVLHLWSQITDQVTYLSVRPDPDRKLPGGYVNPLLLKNQAIAAK